MWRYQIKKTFYWGVSERFTEEFVNLYSGNYGN
jgi:hypothetical protein